MIYDLLNGKEKFIDFSEKNFPFFPEKGIEFPRIYKKIVSRFAICNSMVCILMI
jgi:hypothetical protein